MNKSVASASRRKKKRTRRQMNENVVMDYLAKLEAALGDDELFLPVFEDLKRDRAVQQPEAVAIASRFVAPTSASTSRGRALERVLRRHQSLVSFKLKQRAMGGRSAA